MAALIKAAKKEGTLNVIALPHSWADYGQIIAAFSKQVPHQDQLREPERQQPGRGQRGQPADGHEPSARRRRPGPDHHAGEPGALHALQGRRVERSIPKAEGRTTPIWYDDYTGYESIGYAPTS